MGRIGLGASWRLLLEKPATQGVHSCLWPTRCSENFDWESGSGTESAESNYRCVQEHTLQMCVGTHSGK